MSRKSKRSHGPSFTPAGHHGSKPLAHRAVVAPTPGSGGRSTPTKKRQGSWSRFVHIVGTARLITVAVAIVLIVGGSYGWLLPQMSAPSNSTQEVTVTVAPGESLSQLGNQLQKVGVVRNGGLFYLWARQKGLATSLESGNYHLPKDLSLSQVLDRVQAGPSSLQQSTLTLPDGLTAAQMAALVGSTNIGVTAASYKSALNANYAQSYLAWRPTGDNSLEGFLFPDTFDLSAQPTAAQIVALQLNDFQAKAAPLMGTPPQGYSAYQVLIVASIIEKEAGKHSDYPIVAGVIYNRLAIGMPLELDTTVLYGLGLIQGPLTTAQLAQDTPYNTYLHTGLPPTPISNPGTAAIEAALHPAHTPYFFFVSDGCGNLHYSITDAVHQQQVNQYVGQPCTTSGGSSS